LPHGTPAVYCNMAFAVGIFRVWLEVQPAKQGL
jgi:hypothetical protein